MSRIVFSVGSQLVEFTAASPEILAALERLFPNRETATDESRIKQINTPFDSLELAIIALSECIMEEHQGNLWIDAAALCSPTGSTVLLCGASEAGKSTLTVALCEKNWKVVAEDVVIILPDGSIPSLVRPIRLRPDTAERIKREIGHAVDLEDGRWYFRSGIFSNSRFQLPLSSVILIKGVKQGESEKLLLSQISAEQLLRELLPCSNALRIIDGVDLLLHCLINSPCLLIEGGSISQRMVAIENL